MSDDSPGSAAVSGAHHETTVVHLLRHGEVENPRGLIYGRLPGYHLSEDGRMMAKAAADFLAERDVVAIFTSPLDRARETAEPVAERFGLEPVVDDRLIEPWNHFEGMVWGWATVRCGGSSTGGTCATRSRPRGVSRTGRSWPACWPRWPVRGTPPAATRPSA